VRVRREGVQGALDVLGERLALAPRQRDLANLRLRRDLSGQQQVEDPFGEGLRAPRRLRKLRLHLRDAHPTVADPLLRIDRGGLGDHALEAAHAAVGLSDAHLGDGVVGVGGEDGLDVLLEGCDFGGKLGLE
jgi:hypothetical protein